MIVKFDGIDGCGKSTLAQAVAQKLSQRHTVAMLSEFASRDDFPAKGNVPAVISFLKIREIALDSAFGCDDVERQLLLHFLSRRHNRTEFPLLDKQNDFVIVDRSTLSNYAYATAVDLKLLHLSDLACGNIECADLIFLINTPIATCVQRIMGRDIDAVEQKGQAYLECVQRNYLQYASRYSNVRMLDGRKSVTQLVDEVTHEIRR